MKKVMRKGIYSCFVSMLLVLPAVHAASPSAYLGQKSRALKALSSEEISGYLEGKGAGLAKAAELNHYPGPAHVLELAQELGLNEAQIRHTEHVFDAMQQDAQRLGKTLVEKEQELDREFAQQTIDLDRLKTLLDQIGLLQTGIRLQHLQAHLEQAVILSEAQRARYDTLRGYTAGPEAKSQQHVH